MKKNLKHGNIGVILGVSLVFFFALLVSALADTFNLDYSLTEGGLRLELNPTNLNRGVTINVTSDVGVRYEVIQNIIRPLVNRDHPMIFLSNNLVLRGIRGSNKLGVLHAPATDSPVRSGEIIYTSDTAGTQDSFTLVYGFINTQDVEPGYYQGRISFTLKPIGSGREQVTKFLDVYVETTKATAEPQVEIITADGSKTIRLNSRDEKRQSAEVMVKIKGDMRKIFNITQSLTKPIESKEGNTLDYEAVSFKTQEARKGVGAAMTTLSAQPQNVYNSGPAGEADEYFIIVYQLGDLSRQKAGRYTVPIQHVIEVGGVPKILDTLELEIENERVFDLLITPQDQLNRIEFRDLKANAEPRQTEVAVQIKTNVGRQYQLSQNVYSDLVDKEGNAIAQENFSLRTETFADTKGVAKLSQKAAVKKGETVLFISDNEGSSDRFKLIYELKCPRDLKAGDYSTRISYSLLEI